MFNLLRITRAICFGILFYKINNRNSNEIFHSKQYMSVNLLNYGPAKYCLALQNETERYINLLHDFTTLSIKYA